MASDAAQTETWSMLVQDSVGPFWVEVAIVISFTLGFLLLRPPPQHLSVGARAKGSGKVASEPAEFDQQVKTKIDTESEAGNAGAVLAAWRSAKDAALTPTDTMKLVVKAFMEAEPDSMQRQVIEHFRGHPDAFTPDHAVAALDAVARNASAETLELFWTALRLELHLHRTSMAYSLLLAGYAAAGDERRVAAAIAEMKAYSIRRTPRHFSLTMKGFLKNGLMHAVREQLQEMVALGLEVPSFAINQYCRLSIDKKEAESALNDMKELGLELPPEATAYLLEDCFRRGGVTLANRIDKYVQRKGLTYSQDANQALLKLYATTCDPRALTVFRNMQALEQSPSEAFCVALLGKCAESKSIRLADEILSFSRKRGTMSIAAYSALMKVYAYSGMYDQACDLYQEIVAEGFEPDAVMYGCLMRFAVECGRTDLSRELSNKVPCMEIQNYMALIRAAGRDRDAAKALEVLEQIKKAKMEVDIAAYNCALDAIVSAGDVERAEKLMEEIRSVHTVDIISYNTLLKGYCAKGDLVRAKALLVEMAADGRTPNDVSFNSVINAAVSAGNLTEAWAIVDEMERKGVPVDHFTLSIMMKSLKRAKGQADVQKLLALLDRSGLDVAQDEVLLNAVLDVCVRFRQLPRLERILTQCLNGKLHPAVHTYGAFIKACATLKWVDKCRELWKEMTEHRAMEPNAVVLGCILDSLVTNKRTEEAVAIFRQWKAKVPPNAVMFSTLMKGFAANRKAQPAMELWREMREAKVPLNTVVYNAVIDAQARVGAMDNVTELVQGMEVDGCRCDEITYSTIVKGYCVHGDAEAAYRLYRDTQQHQTAKDAVIYNTLLDGCTTLNRFDLADQLLQDMDQGKVDVTNFTLGIVVKMWGRRHKLDKAFDAMARLPKEYGLTPNAQVLGCLLGACLNNGAVDKAADVFERMRRDFGVDAKAYSSMISGCTRYGDFKRGCSLLLEAAGLSEDTDRGLPPGQGLQPEPAEHMLRTMVSKGYVSDAVSLLAALAGSSIRINKNVAAAVLQGSAVVAPSKGRKAGQQSRGDRAAGDS